MNKRKTNKITTKTWFTDISANKDLQRVVMWVSSSIGQEGFCGTHYDQIVLRLTQCQAMKLSKQLSESAKELKG